MRSQGRDCQNQAGDSPGSVVWLMGQMIILPFRVFVYGMELLVDAMKGMQTTGQRGLDVFAGGNGTPERPEALPETQAAPVSAARSSEAATSGTQVEIAEVPVTETANEEKRNMDKDLNDDMLKLVRFKVLFVKRDYEHVFGEWEELVSDNLDGPAFAAWQIAKFVQRMGSKKVKVPDKWKDEVNDTVPDWVKTEPKLPRTPPNGKADADLTGLDEDEKKYLRVYYDVLERYPREKLKFEEDQLKELRGIREAISKK